MQILTNTTQFDRSPQQPRLIYLSNPYDIDPSDEMFGDMNTKFVIDFSALDLDYARLYFIA